MEDVVNTCMPNLILEAELEKLGHRESLHHDLNKKADSNEASEELESKPIPTVLGTYGEYFFDIFKIQSIINLAELFFCSF